MRPYLRVANVFEDRIDTSDVMEMHFEPQEVPRFELKYGDILLNEGQSKELVGRPAMYRGELPGACFTNSLVRFQASKVIEPKFALATFLSWLKSGKFQPLAQVTTNIAHLGAGRFANMELALPPLPEQRRIVAKLDELLARSRKAREALEAIPPLLEKLRQSILAAAFRGDLTASWREKNPDVEPASVLLQRIRAERRKKWEEAELARLTAKGKTPLGDSWKDRYQEPEPVNTEGLPELPEGWCWATTAELASPEEYSLAIGPFGSDLKVEDYKDQGVPLVFVRHIKAQNFEGMNPKYVSEEKAFDLRAHMVSPGDVLVTKMGDPPGDVAVYPENRPSAVITADCLKWRLSKSAGTPRYFEQALCFPFCQDQLLGITQGVAQRKISLERFKTLFVPVPPIREQEELCALLDKAFENTKSIKTFLKNSSADEQALCASILAKAFRGELVAQDPADEPAEVMLERLRKEQEQAPVASKRGRKPKEGGKPAGKKAKGGQGTLF